MISMAKRTVLFLAANACGTDRARSTWRRTRSGPELRRSGYRDRFQLETQWAVQPLDLLRDLRELRPAVVHFSGQGGPTAQPARHARTARRPGELRTRARPPQTERASAGPSACCVAARRKFSFARVSIRSSRHHRDDHGVQLACALTALLTAADSPGATTAARVSWHARNARGVQLDRRPARSRRPRR
jgi:hypothetical protein